MAWWSWQAKGLICGCWLVAAVAAAAPPGAITPIHHIQGAGPASPLVGRTVTTRGIVTAVFPGLRGWFLQDESGDGDPRTSDGVFVFANRGPIDVAVGERIELTATVTEYAARAGEPTLTELVRPAVVARLGTGRIAPTPVALPEAVDGDLERVEGMLVTFADPLTVSQTFFLGRHGQLTLSAGGRMTKPTQLHRPGSPAAAALAALNARRRIVLDDGRSAARTADDTRPVPYRGVDGTVRAGDTVTGLTGVVDSGRVSGGGGVEVDYRVHPTMPPVITRVNARPAAPPPVGGTHRVAAFNLGNWFTTFRDGTTSAGGAGHGCLPSGTTTDCRGAADARAFASQRARIVAAIAALDADVVGLVEVQRNGGVAVADLVAALNARPGSVRYAAVPDPIAGVGTDAIQVAIIHRPARVAAVGGALADTAVVHGRHPVAQTFATPDGARFSVVVAHFKSKRCVGADGPDLDRGDGQGCYNDRRRRQAAALAGFVGTVQAAAGDPDVFVIGDLNAYGREDPLETLAAAGLADQLARCAGPADYSYVFDGEAGTLDHALATASAAALVTGAAHWHIDADEPPDIDDGTGANRPAAPWRASDHDPVVIGLTPVRTAPVRHSDSGHSCR